MPATITLDPEDGRDAGRAVFIRRGKINLGVYATGGVAVTARGFDLAAALVDLDVRPAGGYVFEWDKTNAKVKAYRENGAGSYTQNATLVEVANAVNLTAVEARFRAEGR